MVSPQWIHQQELLISARDEQTHFTDTLRRFLLTWSVKSATMPSACCWREKWAFIPNYHYSRCTSRTPGLQHPFWWVSFTIAVTTLPHPPLNAHHVALWETANHTVNLTVEKLPLARNRYLVESYTHVLQSRSFPGSSAPGWWSTLASQETFHITCSLLRRDQNLSYAVVSVETTSRSKWDLSEENMPWKVTLLRKGIPHKQPLGLFLHSPSWQAQE